MKEPLMPDAILQEALSREVEARDFYGRLAERTSVTLVRDFLERLKNEESKHVRLVEEMIAKLNLGRNVV
jgi:rubrerythrin